MPTDATKPAGHHWQNGDFERTNLGKTSSTVRNGIQHYLADVGRSGDALEDAVGPKAATQRRQQYTFKLQSRRLGGKDSQGALQEFFFLFLAEGRHRLQRGTTTKAGPLPPGGKTHLRANSS